MKIPEYINKMTDEELLEVLDDYGGHWGYIHEAASRIRELKFTLRRHGLKDIREA